MDRLEETYARGDIITGIATGYHDLDELLSGLQASTLNIVGARPAMGKCVAWDTPMVDTATGEFVTALEFIDRGRGRRRRCVRRPSTATAVTSALDRQHCLADGVKPVFRLRTRVVVARSSITASHPLLTPRGWRPVGRHRRRRRDRRAGGAPGLRRRRPRRRRDRPSGRRCRRLLAACSTPRRRSGSWRRRSRALVEPAARHRRHGPRSTAASMRGIRVRRAPVRRSTGAVGPLPAPATRRSPRRASGRPRHARAEAVGSPRHAVEVGRAGRAVVRFADRDLDPCRSSPTIGSLGSVGRRRRRSQRTVASRCPSRCGTTSSRPRANCRGPRSTAPCGKRADDNWHPHRGHAPPRDRRPARRGARRRSVAVVGVAGRRVGPDRRDQRRPAWTQVIDFTVPGTHNFVAADLFLHNTAFGLGMAVHVAKTRPSRCSCSRSRWATTS